MKIFKILLSFLSFINADFIFAMKHKGLPLHIVRRSQTPPRRIPILNQATKVESMAGSTLSMLARGLLEQPQLDRKGLTRVKVLLHTAARQLPPDPLALYLTCQTTASAVSCYIPSMYMFGLKCIEQSFESFTPEQQQIIQRMLTTLKQHRLPDETALPLLQNKAIQAHCQLPTTGAQYQPTIETAVGMLHKIVSSYIQDTTDAMNPWIIRSCYALGMMQTAGIYSSCLQDGYNREIQPISIAACEEFEPAIFEFIKLRVQHDKNLNIILEQQFNSFVQATRRIEKASRVELTPYAIESMIEDSIFILNFFDIFGKYIEDIPIGINCKACLIHTLKTIADNTNDYRARCLLAITQLNNNSQESITQAFSWLEPVINNQHVQLFLAKYSTQDAKEFLKEQAESDTNASFILGLILCATKSTHLESYQYFTMGAEKNHFYSLCCAANMIRKGFDQEKNLFDAVNYYKNALTCAPTQTQKRYVIDTLKTLADCDCLPARCLYLIALLDDITEQATCNTILQSIEEYPQEEFNKHIACFKTYFILELRNIAEKGNDLALRLLGYIYYSKVQNTIANGSFTPYLCELHTSLGKLRGHSTTPRSRELTSSIAFTLACHYRQIGNIPNALRLLNIASEYNHKEAPRIRALLQLKLATSSSMVQDVKLTEQLADQGDLEAQEILAKLYSDATCLILLAKKLCSTNTKSDHQINLRAYEMFIQAKQQGYQLQEEDCMIFGKLAFTLEQDDQALELLERCQPDKSISWLLAILYMRNSDKKESNFEKAIQSLSKVLLIEDDDIEVPQEGEDYIPFVLQKLKGNLHLSAPVKELFIRLCYAQGLDENTITHHELLQLAISLASSPSLSALNLLLFLQRHGINMYDSLRQPLNSLQQVIRLENPETDFFEELQEQLEHLANPLLIWHKNFAKKSKDEIEIAIRAAHLLASICYKDDLLYACTYFVMAEEAISMLYHKDHPLFNLAYAIGSIATISELAEQQNQDALVAIMIYRGYRHLRGKYNFEDISKWLITSRSIILHYTRGQVNERDMLMATFYVLIGKITTLNHQHIKTNTETFHHYFEYALSLDPDIASAKSYIASIQLYDHRTTDEQRIQAIKTLQELAINDNSEACFTLGKLYEPGAEKIPGRIKINPDLELSKAYFEKATFHASNPEPSDDLSPCNVM